MSKRCSAKNRSGQRCGAWAARGAEKCTLLLNPELAAKMGAKHGRKAIFPAAGEPSDTPSIPLKKIADVGELLEETINRVRQSPFDLRAANTIGFLSGILVKVFDQKDDERLAYLEQAVALMTGIGRFEFRRYFRLQRTGESATDELPTKN